jgi:hypothetical protein
LPARQATAALPLQRKSTKPWADGTGLLAGDKRLERRDHLRGGRLFLLHVCEHFQKSLAALVGAVAEGSGNVPTVKNKG